VTVGRGGFYSGTAGRGTCRGPRHMATRVSGGALGQHGGRAARCGPLLQSRPAAV
jgi:hypothetical protein